MAKTANAKVNYQKPPPRGEETKSQTRQDANVWFQPFPAFEAPPPGTFETYRKMRGNPTIALARIAATSSIRNANVSFESREGGTNDMVEFVKRQIEPMWPYLIRELLMSMDYGFSAFEKVWEAKPFNGVLRWGYRKLKPLQQDKTKIMEDKQSGGFAGLQQDSVKMSPEKSMLYTYDGENGNPYGRSRNENLREDAWHPWKQVSKKLGRYVTKVAGVMPMVEYPPGQARDASGATRDTYDLAKKIISDLSSGNGVLMPNQLSKYAMDLVRSGADMEQMQSWKISFLEPKGQHGADLVAMMRYYDSLMLRGWIVPERAAVEGQYGTKAEATQHADLALQMASMVLEDILRCVNWYVVNPLLAYNWGEEAQNKVVVERVGMDPVEQMFFREIIKTVLTSSKNVDLFLSMMELDSIFDSVGIPKGEWFDNKDKRLPRTPNIPNEKSEEEEVEGEKSQLGPRSVTAAIRTMYRSLQNAGNEKS